MKRLRITVLLLRIDCITLKAKATTAAVGLGYGTEWCPRHKVIKYESHGTVAARQYDPARVCVGG